MTVTSVSFLLLVSGGLLLYYLLPKAWQWAELLVLSMVFYCLAAVPGTLLYLMFSTGTAYAATLISDSARRRNKSSRVPFTATVLGICASLLVWLLVKGKGLWAFAKRPK